MGLHSRDRSLLGTGLGKELWGKRFLSPEEDVGEGTLKTAKKAVRSNGLHRGRVKAQVCLEDMVEFNLATAGVVPSPFNNENRVF